jgi:hypothetical protein
MTFIDLKGIGRLRFKMSDVAKPMKVELLP